MRSLWQQLPRLTSMRWAALPITDRRWTAPFAAIALGFGLFIGVAIGPGVSGTFGGSGPMVIEIPAPVASSESPGEGPTDKTATTPGTPDGPEGRTSPGPGTASLPPLPPVAPAPSFVPAPVPLPETPATTPTTPAPQEPEPSPGPGPAPGLSFDGTVLQVNRVAGSYTLALPGGRMVAVHASDLPEPGDTVEVPVRELNNRTYAEDGRREVTGMRKKIAFSGIVSFRDPQFGVYTVSRKGASVLVRAASDPVSELPRVGDLVDVTAQIEAIESETSSSGSPRQAPPADPAPTDPTAPTPDPLPLPLPSDLAPLPNDCGTRPKPPPEPETRLVEVKVKIDTESLTYAEIEGIVQGVCRDKNQLIISADALNESRSDITIAVPEDGDFDLGAIRPGAVLALTATISRDGSLVLEGLSSDRRKKGADDASLAQGDQA